MSYLDAYVRRYLAEKLGDVTPDQIVGYRFNAEPERQWSEVTIDSFACQITVMVAGANSRRNIFLNDEETCEFLNGYGSEA